MKKKASPAAALWLVLPLLPFSAAFFLLGSDTVSVLAWWLSLSALGWLVWPLVISLFPGNDCGSLFARPLGMALGGFLVWTLSYLHLLPFRRWSIVLVLLLLGAAAWFYRQGWQKALRILQMPGQIRRIAAGECLFSAGLIFWSFARGLKPELDSLEKFMNIGFMNSLWRTDYLPAADMWYAGGKINYYYFGQYIYTFLAKLTDIRPETAYNLSMATTFALTLTLGYAVGSRLIGLIRRHEPGLASFWQTIGGLASAFLVTVAGNSHSFFYARNGPGHGLLQWAHAHGWVGGDAGLTFWFADSTRFIGYNPETADKTIHEFPYYSFLVADLHAHLINLAFVLLFIGLLTSLIDRPGLIKAAADCRDTQARTRSVDDRSWLRVEFAHVLDRLKVTSADGLLWLAAVLLAIFMMGNYWDFAIYFTVITVVLILVNGRGYGRLIRLPGLFVFGLQCVLILIPFLRAANPWTAILFFGIALAANSILTLIVGDALTLAGAQVSWLFFVAHVLALPFNRSFEPISKTIALAVSHTPFWQLMILWGPHLLTGMVLLVYLVRRGPGRMINARVFPPVGQAAADAASAAARQADDRSVADASAEITADQKIPRLDRFILAQNPGDLLLLALLLCAAGLILLPELVYVVDIYSGDYKRSNTMFKFTYQAFVLLSPVWGCSLARIAGHRRRPSGSMPRRDAAGFAPDGRNDGFDRRKDRLPAVLTAVFLALMIIIPGWYPIAATGQWLGSFTVKRYQGLDGLKLFAQKDSAQVDGQAAGELAPDYAAIQWFNDQVPGQPVILEAFGSSYTDECRISAFTGLPTVIGWETHEWLWRTSKANPSAYGSVVQPRQEDIRILYTSSDQVLRRSLIVRYQIDYIIIGKIERQKFSENPDVEGSPSLIQENLLLEMGTVAFTNQDLVVIRTNRTTWPLEEKAAG